MRLLLLSISLLSASSGWAKEVKVQDMADLSQVDCAKGRISYHSGSEVEAVLGMVQAQMNVDLSTRDGQDACAALSATAKQGASATLLYTEDSSGNRTLEGFLSGASAHLVH